MFVYSVRASGIRYFLLVTLTLIVLVGSIIVGNSDVMFASAEGEINFGGITDNEGRIAFIKQFGYEVLEEPISETAFSVPSNFDRIITDYNEIQRRQGLDLSKYANKKVTRYTYEIKNYEGYDGVVYANLFVYRDRVIGCDVSSADPSGFVLPLIVDKKN